MDRRSRLAKILALQQRLKELHQSRHAAHLKEAAAAEYEADALLDRLQATDSFGSLFPDLYHDRIGRALARKNASLAKAAEEAASIAAANARTDLVRRAYLEEVQQHERKTEERAILDIVEQRQHTRTGHGDG